MISSITYKNTVLLTFLIAGLTGVSYESYQSIKVSKVNHLISTDQLVMDDTYPQLKKFTAAYDQGLKKDYKHAVQTYSQLLDTSPPPSEQAKIQYNIANNLFEFGLIRRINDDGTLQDEARYAYTQAKLAYEQSLRLEPSSAAVKFNLSLLHSVMGNHMKAAPKDQSTMELSNLPIGLP